MTPQQQIAALILPKLIETQPQGPGLGVAKWRAQLAAEAAAWANALLAATPTSEA
jgi:hypothetical protein